MMAQKFGQIRVEDLAQRRASVALRVPVNRAYSVRRPERAAGGEGAAELRAGQSGAALQAEHYEPLPHEEDYIYPLFRALSRAVIPGYWLDFTKAGVLEAAAPLLAGQTVYKNHWDWDVESWIGVVNASQWDASGEAVGGIPGINVELKIDTIKCPAIARGLLIEPPAIHSVSVKVMFVFEFSHPKLDEEGLFWRILGQEVDGEIVRMVVTEITGFGELSLVNRGADKLAKKLPTNQPMDEDDDDEVDSDDEVEADTKKKKRAMSAPDKGETTVKLTAEQIAALGLKGEAGQDFPEATVLGAVETLAERARLGAEMVAAQRTECRAQARLAAGVPEDGKLAVAVELAISAATPEQLREMTAEFAAQAAEKFPQTCQSCGKAALAGRSSVETGAVETPQKKPVIVRRSTLG
jgi:hypothetical protein